MAQLRDDYASLGGMVVGSCHKAFHAEHSTLDWHATAALLPASFVIALISFMEAMSSCKVIAIKTRQPWMKTGS